MNQPQMDPNDDPGAQDESCFNPVSKPICALGTLPLPVTPLLVPEEEFLVPTPG